MMLAIISGGSIVLMAAVLICVIKELAHWEKMRLLAVIRAYTETLPSIKKACLLYRVCLAFAIVSLIINSVSLGSALHALSLE